MSVAVPFDTTPRATRASCAHCGRRVTDEASYCCAGCEGAHALIGQLGLGAYYARRPVLVDGAPADAVATDPTPFVRVDNDTCQVDLAIDGLHCAACVWLIETALSRDESIVRARVNATDRRLRLAWTGSPAKAREIAELVAKLGYRVAPFLPDAMAGMTDAEERFLLRCMAVAGFATANVMLLSVSVWAGLWGGQHGMGDATRDLLHWISAAIALPALAYAIRPFARSAWGAVRQGHGNMDVPIVVGVALTAALSLAQTAGSADFAYFESATMLVFLLLVGRYVERRARGMARSATANLLSLGAGTATIETANGTLRVVTPAQVDAGDTLYVAAGERLAADGVLLEGTGPIDNAFVTGESAAAAIAAGDEVHAGAVNLGGPLRIRVSAAGEATLLARVARLLEAAEQGRLRHVALSDRVSRWYAPIVHLLALATFLFWAFVAGSDLAPAMVAAISVLIVTCPCALALAQPAVSTVAIGRLARHGVLIVSPTALERLGSIDTVVFDKTGTLTLGKPWLVEDAARDPADLLLAAAIAAGSRHPLARALVAAAGDVAPIRGVTERPGRGLEAGDVRVGSRQFCGITDDPVDERAEFWLARPRMAPTRFAFEDRLRPDAASTIALLRRRGMEVRLLSGDRASVVARIAAEAGIDAFEAEASPEDKIARVQALAASGARVLMVGDGINDAPALGAAHAALSPGSATDVATAAADGIFRGDLLAPVAETLRVARVAAGATRINLALAVLYNTAAVPVAMLGLLTPPVAAVAMSLSSLLVVANALRVGRAGAQRETTP